MVKDGRVSARKPTALVRQLTQIDAVAQQLVQIFLVDLRANTRLTVLRRPGLGGDALQCQCAANLGGGAHRQHVAKNTSHNHRFSLVDDQQAVLDDLNQFDD